MYLLQQRISISTADELVNALDIALAAQAYAAFSGDEVASALFTELAGLAQGRLLELHSQATGKDLGQIENRRS